MKEISRAMNCTTRINQSVADDESDSMYDIEFTVTAVNDPGPRDFGFAGFEVTDVTIDAVSVNGVDIPVDKIGGDVLRFFERQCEAHAYNNAGEIIKPVWYL